MKDNFVFSKGSFFHGTKAALKIGDFLIIGQKKNYNDDRKSEVTVQHPVKGTLIFGQNRENKISVSSLL